MKVVLAGSGGLLGANVLLAALERGLQVVALWRDHPVHSPGCVSLRADLSEPGTALRILRAHRPDWVINCAALTDIDLCERDPGSAERINALVPRLLAEAAAETGAGLAHISSDAVHDGRRGGYSEADEPNPVNQYARSKRRGEEAVMASRAECLLLRTNLFGWNSREKTNLAEWVVSSLEARRPINGFTDTVFNPLLANDLAEAILDLIGKRASGLFHLGSADACSKYDFAMALADAFGLDRSLISRARQADQGSRTPRPLNTTLEVGKAEAALGRGMPALADGIARFRRLRDEPYYGRLKELSMGAMHA